MSSTHLAKGVSGTHEWIWSRPILFCLVFLVSVGGIVSPTIAVADNSPGSSSESREMRDRAEARADKNGRASSRSGESEPTGYRAIAIHLAEKQIRKNARGIGGSIPKKARAMVSSLQSQKTISVLDREDDSSILSKSVSFLGLFFLIGIAWLLSANRRAVDWQLVGVGIGLQLLFAVVIFHAPGGQAAFEIATDAVSKVIDFTDRGSEFLFKSYVTDQWEPGLINFAFSVLPTIIFFSALMTILYHLGVMQKIVYFFALAMQKVMNTSGAETLSATANIFVGQTEAPLVVKPYVEEMTMSELMVVMTGGFATVAGGVLAIYVGMLESTFPNIAGHLIAASVMSAPAALVIAKIMYPETEVPVTRGSLEMDEERPDVNVLDAASRGASEGLKLAMNVGAMLLAFLALIEMINYLIQMPSSYWNTSVLHQMADHYRANGLAIPKGCAPAGVDADAIKGCAEKMAAASGSPDVWIAPKLTLEAIFGYVFWPFAWIMGVPTQDCLKIGQLLGEKMVVNEMIAYTSLADMVQNPTVNLQPRSVVIATYALCGFANFGSIGIQLGGIGGIAPSRMSDLAKIALKAMIGGTLAAFMTATVAGILV